MKLAILNTRSFVFISEGDYSLRKINLEEAQQLAQEYEILSAVGHVSTAEILTELLGVHVPVNPIMFVQEPGQIALIFKLRGRLPEGKILNREEIENIGYDFFTLIRKEEEK